MTTLLKEISMERDIAVRMRDGVVLKADIYRPEAPGTYPILLLRIPYNKTVAQGYVYANPIWYARHGYVVVVQDTRGRFASEGEFVPLVCDARDGADTIEWCSTLPGTTGKVASFGFSYSGINQLLAASEQPAALAAACPGFYPTSMYDDFAYSNGAFCLATIAQWLTILAPAAAARRNNVEALATVGAAEALVGAWSPAAAVGTIPLIAPNELTPFAADFLAHPQRGAFWETTDLAARPPVNDLPCLHLGGWYDTFINQTLANFQRMQAESNAEQRLVIGPWLHMPWTRQVGEIDFGPEAANSGDDHQLAFFDAHLKNDRRRLDATPPVSVFMMGRNKWISLDAWPPKDGRPTRLYLHSKGKANSSTGDGWLDTSLPGDEVADVYVYDPMMPVPSVGGHACCSPDTTPMGAYDQSVVQMRNDVLIYTTAPMPVAQEVVGPVEVELWVSTTAVDTDFTAKLCHVRNDGRCINLCEGIQRLRFATDPAREIFLEPGRPHAIRFLVGHTALHLEPGEQLRLEVTSSNYPAFDRHSNTGCPIGQDKPFEPVQALQSVLHDAEHASAIDLYLRHV